nr:MAG TPA: hypothetical protein [Crassvirales sp.]
MWAEMSALFLNVKFRYKLLLLSVFVLHLYYKS